MKSIKGIAINIDGVLLQDTFSPVIKSLVQEFGGVYDRDVERNVFSQGQQDAALYLIHKLSLDMSVDQLIATYFKQREIYIRTQGSGLNLGALSFLERVQGWDVTLLCYGGLSKQYFQKEAGQLAHYFRSYVCTNGFRPGVKQMIEHHFQLKPEQVVFIDDVNRVAEAAKQENTGFIGMPAPFEWGFQRQDMKDTGVKYIVDKLDDINLSLIEKVDQDLSGHVFWKGGSS